MATKLQEVQYLDLKGGVDYASRPHEVALNAWTVLEGMRYERGALVQVPHLVLEGRMDIGLPMGIASPTMAVWNSLGNKDHMALYVAGLNGSLSHGVILQVGVGTYPNMYKATLQLNGADFTYPTGIVLRPPTYAMDVLDYLASVKYANQWWCTGKRVPLFCISNGKILQDTSTPLPQGQYITQFFDHLVVGNYAMNGYKNPMGIACSDIYKPWSWDAAPENEADAWDVEEFCQQGGSSIGITGFSWNGESLLVFTDSSIVAFDYVGLPNIFRYSRIRPDVGNCLPRGLARYGGYTFFFDRGTFNFYQYDGQGMSQIGDKILSYISSVLPPSIDNAPNAMYEYARSFVLPQWNLVCWSIPFYNGTDYVFKNIGYNPFNKTWVHWSYTLVNGGFTYPHPLGATPVIGPTDGFNPPTINEWDTHVNDATNFINEEPSTAGTSPFTRKRITSQIYFDGLAMLRDQVASSGTANNETIPVLETGDRSYGSLDKVKEVHGVALHSSYASGAGVEVSIATRNNISDVVTWQVVGVWNPNLPDRRLTFPPIAGKIFRFRFRGLGDPSVGAIRGWRLDAFSEFVYGNSAER